MEKEKLIPVQAPWHVSYATPFLKLSVTEYGTQQVEFIGSFWSKDLGSHERMITLTFKWIHSYRGSLGSNERNALREGDYDWTDVPFRALILNDFEAYKLKYQQHWEATGFCSNPLMYEVMNSHWLTPEDVSFGEKHFLIMGEIMYVEILAGEWSWEAGEVIDWTKG